MRSTTLHLMLAALVCFLAFSGQARATANINGSTSISYDPWTNIVTGVTTTELDYASQDWYQARVNGSITDANGNLVAGTFANDLDRDGTVSVTMQGSAVDQMEYTCTGTHIALADISDYFQGHYYYVDNYNFGYYQSESTYRIFFYTFAGVGPMKRRSSRSLDLGQTYAIVQAKPRIGLETATFSPPSVNKTNGETTLSAAISASTNIQAGDKAVVELIQTTPGGSFTFPSTVDVPLTSNHSETATFNVRTNVNNNLTGTVNFQVRILDVLRPNGQGGFTSLLNTNPPGVTISPADGRQASLGVNP